MGGEDARSLSARRDPQFAPCLTKPVADRACGYGKLEGYALNVVPSREQPKHFALTLCELANVVSD